MCLANVLTLVEVHLGFFFLFLLTYLLVAELTNKYRNPCNLTTASQTDFSIRCSFVHRYSHSKNSDVSAKRFCMNQSTSHEHTGYSS